MKKKTIITPYFDGSVIESGDSNYPVVGELGEGNERIFRALIVGYPVYGYCMEKARAIHNLVPGGIIAVGGLMVKNAAFDGEYGFEYHPEKGELHAWLELGPFIVDLALPGVILKGLSIVDDQGPMLEGRDPCILAGTPPEWLVYTAREYFT